jgi:ABC-type phosphate transport system substrate-binding protein
MDVQPCQVKGDMEMTKKLLIAALALLVAAPVALADVGCTTGGTPVPQVIMVGSSAQFNATAYAAQNIIAGEGAGFSFNLFSVKGKDTAGNGLADVIDHRIAGDPRDGATLWVAWDGGAPCKFWAYYSTDSGVGVKDFFAYGKNGTKSVAFAYGSLSGLEDGSAGNTWCGASCSRNKVFGLTDTSTFNGGDNLPTSILNVLNAHPDGTSVPKQCTGTTNCYFNAAGTDIRPEDALYATTRALSNYDTKSLNGLGYNSASCGGDGLATASKIGCPIYGAMGSGSKFFVSTFKLTGTDPIASGTVPASTTIPVGYAPQLVIVNNSDATGFGRKSGANYVFTNINREVLSQVFQGNLQNTDDLLSTGATAGASTGPKIQVIQREVLSGTYNTFEFTGVRTLYGSGRTLAVRVANTNVTSNAWSGQEVGINPGTNNFSSDPTNCPTTGFPTGSSQCHDPLWVGSTGAGFKRMRAIGTGEEVPAIVNAMSGQSASASSAPDGIGYTFWSFGNVKPAAGLGHYLTVDSVDPLFNSPTDGSNTAGNYNLPTCAAPPCAQVIPFTHVIDGTYPLWSLLRTVTLKTTPAAVTALINSEITLANNNGLDEFQPLLDASGHLQVFVFRSHFKPAGSTVAPLNGHKTCTSFAPPTPAATCLVDAGGDVGGAVFTVQADVSFFLNTGMELLGVVQ